MEYPLEVKNPAKPFPDVNNSIVASWADVKLFCLVPQILYYQEPISLSGILTKFSELWPHPESLNSQSSHSFSKYVWGINCAQDTALGIHSKRTELSLPFKYSLC